MDITGSQTDFEYNVGLDVTYHVILDNGCPVGGMIEGHAVGTATLAVSLSQKICGSWLSTDRTAVT